MLSKAEWDVIINQGVYPERSKNMSKMTKNKLREIKIYNPHGLATRGQSKLYIGFTPGDNDRMAHYPYWAVVGIGFKVDPDGHWATYGNKQFSINCRAEKIPSLNKAVQWCYDKFHIPTDQWEKDPFGGWQIKGTIQQAKAEGK
ncbi:hypothetical protein LCGC14_1737960 [marine sediment metagenome]|uniref:Uncharacterized protein n=1 Tax=marine sediment metagenome TaxID=412755 RepID=A0A0F9HV76_9ZZZZ